MIGVEWLARCRVQRFDIVVCGGFVVSLGRCYRSRGFSEEEEDRMMISRLMRGRLSSSVRALRRDVSSSHCHITGTVMNLLFSEVFEECEL